MNVISLAAGLLVGILLVRFGAQNAQPVSIHFFGWQTSPVPLILVIGIAMLVGVLLSFVISMPSRFRGKRERRALQRRIDAQEEWLTPNPDRTDVPPQAGE